MIDNDYSEEDIIRKYNNWFEISCHKYLTEDFIIKYQDQINKVDWWAISYFQKLSRKFIKNNFDKLNIKFLLENENISEEIKQELRMYSEIL